MANVFGVKQIIFNDDISPLEAKQIEIVVQGIFEAVENAAEDQNLDTLDQWLADVLGKALNVILLGTQESINDLAKAYGVEKWS
jgi:hypothetical protein